MANRSTLKSYFVKNAIPTQNNFEDLVESSINFEDDRIAPPTGEEPLRIASSSDDERGRVVAFRAGGDSTDGISNEWELGLQLPTVGQTRPALTVRAGGSGADDYIAKFESASESEGPSLKVAGNLEVAGFLGLKEHPAGEDVAEALDLAGGDGAHIGWFSQAGLMTLLGSATDAGAVVGGAVVLRLPGGGSFVFGEDGSLKKVKYGKFVEISSAGWPNLFS